MELSDGLVVIKDRKNNVLEEVSGPIEVLVESNEWKVGEVTIRRMNTCGCGGTIITEKAS